MLGCPTSSCTIKLGVQQEHSGPSTPNANGGIRVMLAAQGPGCSPAEPSLRSNDTVIPRDDDNPVCWSLSCTWHVEARSLGDTSHSSAELGHIQRLVTLDLPREPSRAPTWTNCISIVSPANQTSEIIPLLQFAQSPTQKCQLNSVLSHSHSPGCTSWKGSSTWSDGHHSCSDTHTLWLFFLYRHTLEIKYLSHV